MATIEEYRNCLKGAIMGIERVFTDNDRTDRIQGINGLGQTLQEARELLAEDEPEDDSQ